jgi:hypothetical protein
MKGRKILIPPKIMTADSVNIDPRTNKGNLICITWRSNHRHLRRSCFFFFSPNQILQATILKVIGAWQIDGSVSKVLAEQAR